MDISCTNRIANRDDEVEIFSEGGKSGLEIFDRRRHVDGLCNCREEIVRQSTQSQSFRFGLGLWKLRGKCQNKKGKWIGNQGQDWYLCDLATFEKVGDCELEMRTSSIALENSRHRKRLKAKANLLIAAGISKVTKSLFSVSICHWLEGCNELVRHAENQQSARNKKWGHFVSLNQRMTTVSKGMKREVSRPEFRCLFFLGRKQDRLWDVDAWMIWIDIIYILYQK